MNKRLCALAFFWLILLSACAPAQPVIEASATPAATASPTLIPTEDPVLYRDDFSTLNPDWRFSGDDNQNYSVVGGALELAIKDQTVETVAVLNREFAGDIFVDIDIQEIGPAPQSNLSILCHYDLEKSGGSTLDNRGYLFLIGRRDDILDLIILRIDEGSYEFLAENALESPLINAKTYHVTVECSQERLALGIDGALVLETQDDTYHKGGIGFAVLSNYKNESFSIRFDNSQISTKAMTALVELPAEPTAEPTNAILYPPGKIVFSSSGKLYAINPDGSELTQLTYQGFDSNPRWSPDGQWVAYSSSSQGSSDIWLVSADGEEQHRLTDMPGDEKSPSWSPDGTMLVFTADHRDQDDYISDIYLIHADGSGLEMIYDATNGALSPAWSPGGDGVFYYEGYAIFSLDLTDLTTELVVEDRDLAAMFDWSPDGERIAFHTWRTGDMEIFWMSADGTTARQVTQSPNADQCPSWSPDGQQLVFSSLRSGDLRLYTVSAEGGEPVMLIDMYGTDPDWSAR